MFECATQFFEKTHTRKNLNILLHSGQNLAGEKSSQKLLKASEKTAMAYSLGECAFVSFLSMHILTENV